MPMNPTFLGTWKLDPSKNTGVIEFARAIDVPEELLTMEASEMHSATVSYVGDSVKINLHYLGPMADMDFIFNEGETVIYTFPDGREARMTLEFDEGNPVETFVCEEDSGVAWTVRRTVEGDVMAVASTVSTTVKGISMTQIYNRVK